MRALGLIVTALTLAAAVAPAQALACGMVIREETINLAELMDDIDEVEVAEVEVAVAEVEPVEPVEAPTLVQTREIDLTQVEAKPSNAKPSKRAPTS
jgi:hypothetical protein